MCWSAPCSSEREQPPVVLPASSKMTRLVLLVNYNFPQRQSPRCRDMTMCARCIGAMKEGDGWKNRRQRKGQEALTCYCLHLIPEGPRMANISIPLIGREHSWNARSRFWRGRTKNNLALWWASRAVGKNPPIAKVWPSDIVDGEVPEGSALMPRYSARPIGLRCSPDPLSAVIFEERLKVRHQQGRGRWRARCCFIRRDLTRSSARCQRLGGAIWMLSRTLLTSRRLASGIAALHRLRRTYKEYPQYFSRRIVRLVRQGPEIDVNEPSGRGHGPRFSARHH